MTPVRFPLPPNGGNLARILTDGTERALVDAIEQNCIDFFMEYGRGPGCELHEDPGVTWFATGLPDPLFNGVMTAHLAPTEVNARIDAMMTEFRRRNLPLEWTVGTSTRPRNLGASLEAKGLRNRLVVPGMAMNLEALPDEPLPRGLTVQRATAPADLETCTRVFAANFSIAEPLVPRLVDIEQGMPPDHRENTMAYVGRLDGKPVASSGLFMSAGVAGLYFITTLASARGRGIGRAMTIHALREARGRGYRFGVLQATPMGLPVYERLGFRTYSEFEIYT